MQLHVSLNSQQYTSTNTTLLEYTFYATPVVLSVSPSLGPVEGGTSLTILGEDIHGAGSHRLCRFNSSSVTTAVYDPPDGFAGGFVCRSAVLGGPATASGDVTLQVTLNGQQFGPSSLSYRYYTTPRVSSLLPAAGPIDGGTTVQVRGYGFAGGAGAQPHYLCRFGDAVVNATISGHDVDALLTCISPASHVASHPVQITLNGQNYTNDSITFDWYPIPTISHISPSMGPQDGHTRMLLHGLHLGGGYDTRCRFTNASGDALPLPGTYLPGSSALLCVSPPQVRTPLMISLNAQQYFPANVSYFAEPAVSSLSPTSGPILGDTLINVTGTNLPATGIALCRIGEHIANGTRVNSGMMRCLSPTLHRTRETHVVAHNFSSWPTGSTPGGQASLSNGELLLGSRGEASSVILEADVPAGALPAVPYFEASFHVWAPSPAFSQAEARVPADNSGVADADDALTAPHVLPGLPTPRVNYQPESISYDLSRHDELPTSRENVTSYSFSFGDLHAAIPTGAGQQPFGGAGAGRGLRVRFALATAQLVPLILGGCDESNVRPPCQRRAVRTDVVEVLYDRQVLASAMVARNLSSRGKAVVRVDESGVSVSYRGVQYLSGVALTSWYPQPHWAFGLGAEQHTTDGGVRINEWRLRSAYLHPGHPSPVRVSFNGQQYTGSPVTFDYYRPPALSEASPSSGPVAGATTVLLYGESMGRGSHRLCRFSGTLIVDANLSTAPCAAEATSPKCSHVTCISPAADESNAKLELSLNGQQYHGVQHRASPLERVNDPRFQYLQPAVAESLSPRGGPIVGGTLITLRGYGFAGSNYTCRFENGTDLSETVIAREGHGAGGLLPSTSAVTLATHDIGTNAVRCYSPAALSAQVLAVRISTNAQQYIGTDSNLTFTLYVPHEVEWIEPRSGFLTGWTVVTLHGTGLLQPRTPDGMGLHCKFGDHIVTATVTPTNATCVTPSDAIAGAGLERTDADLVLHGDARRQEEVIRLTEDAPLESSVAGPAHYGYAVLPLPVPDHPTPADPFAAFSATFRLLMDDQGYGMSFTYGDIPDELFTSRADETFYPLTTAYPAAALGESGGSSGLRVLFRTGEERRIIVIFDGERLGGCPLPSRPSTNPYGPWWDVLIEYRPEAESPRHGLHVSFDGIECLPPMPLSHWAPSARWRFGFGARSRSLQARHWMRELHVQMGSRVQTTDTPLVVSGNLQQWSHPVRFIYLGVPRTSTLVPRTGPTAGGTALTLYGSHLYGTRHLCRVAARFPDATGFGDDTTADAGSSEMGSGEAASGQTHILAATYDALDGTVHCEMPPASDLPADLAALAAASAPLYIRVSTNGQQYSRDPHQFNYYDVGAHTTHRLLPASGPTRGGTLINISLADLNASSAEPIRNDGRAACLLNGSMAVASVAADGASLRCVTPPSQDAGDAELTVTLNGQEILPLEIAPSDNSIAYGGSSPPLFHFYTHPSLELLEPLSGPSLRGYSIAVHLYPPVPLAAATGVTCSFGGEVTLGALLPASTPLHLAAAGVLYAPRALTPVSQQATVPGILESHATYTGSHLQESFVRRGLSPEFVDGIQYDADPIDSEGAWMSRGTPSMYKVDGTKFGLVDYTHHYSDPVRGREDWLASATVLQWYHDGKATCVGYGPPNDFCNSSQLVCAAGDREEYGNYDEQAIEAVRAIRSAGGVHPDCPILHRFDPDATAWLHSGAGNWQHSTLIDRGDMSVSTPFAAAMEWREYISSATASQVNCTAPNSSDALAVWQFAIDFNCDSASECASLAAASNITLMGDAELHEGQLRLTRAGQPNLSPTTIGFENRLQPVLHGSEDATRPDTVFAHGVAVLTLPYGTHMLNLHVNFTAIVGAGPDDGGEGFAVSYGGGPLDSIGEFGGGLGLRVQFLTGGGEHEYGSRVHVYHDGDLLGSSPLPDGVGLRAERPVNVSITAETSGVSVRYDGHLLFDRLAWQAGGPGWAPQPDWQLAFSAACAARPDNHWIDNLQVETGTRVADTPVAVSVALNGQQFVDLYESLGYAFETRPQAPPPLS
jgi:hypothetical protein